MLEGKYRNNLFLIISEIIIYAFILAWVIWYFLPQALL
jgi:hypothetical protein